MPIYTSKGTLKHRKTETMGMAASQTRFLAMTQRANKIGVNLMMLSNQRMSLTREMNKISSEYNNALNSKILKWSNNQGISYIDLNYNNLMKPSTLNNYNPYLLTEHNGRVIVDDQYKRYAEMISPKGLAGGDWENNRATILSELTGLSTDDIDSYFDFEKNLSIKADNISEIKRNEVADPVGWTNIEGLLEEIDTKNNNTTDWKNKYLSANALSDNRNDIQNALNSLGQSIGEFFGSNNDSSITDTVNESINDFMDAYDQMDSDTRGQQDWHKAIDLLFGSLIVRLFGDMTYTPQTGTFPINDLNDPQYDSKRSARDAWEAQYNAAVSDYENYAQEFSSKYTAATETNIKFYDSIFSTIADKGWNYNSRINNQEYLNQMLQNNFYTLTSVKRDDVANKNEYKTDIASNITNIFSVNNTDAKDEALVMYEHKKSIVQAKEQRIDIKMKELETEKSAIQQMMQGIKTVIDDNIQRTFASKF